jgi:hypothetical protein
MASPKTVLLKDLYSYLPAMNHLGPTLAIQLFQIVASPELDDESLVITTAEGLFGVRLDPGVHHGLLAGGF